MNDRELIEAFDKSARFYPSGVDGSPCVEFRPAYPGARNRDLVANYAARIRRFQKYGW